MLDWTISTSQVNQRSRLSYGKLTNLVHNHSLTIVSRTLKDSASSLPTEFASFKVLPALASALEFGGASAATILPLVLQFGKNVPPQDYASIIMVHLVKLFSSPDRGTRMALLDHLSEYSDKLDKKTVVDKIWPSLVHLPLLTYEYANANSSKANWFHRYCSCDSRSHSQVYYLVIGQGGQHVRFLCLPMLTALRTAQ